MSAVLRAIFRLCPASKEHTAQCARAWAINQPQSQASLAPFGQNPSLSLLKEQRCIEFYFEHIHGITPLLDEQEFRRKYASGTCQDTSWLGLLNMVFVLGSIASGSDSLHEEYYHQARSFVSLDSLGSGNLEGLQALCLLGGYYLHYRNSPNMAYGVLGAAHRVAIALGLHREPRGLANIVNADEADTYRGRVETRRRTWWSLFCLDTWASMTQGRPTCGRWDSTTMDALLPQPQSPNDHAAISLGASVGFCLICDRIQNRVAQFGRLSIDEIFALDAELQDWYRSLPSLLTQPADTPSRLHVARDFMRSRYFNVRLLLLRSSLLYVANDRAKKVEAPASNMQQLVDTCCAVACEAIDSITLYWTPNRIQVWNSAWYLFQACLVPLLSIAVEKSLGQDNNTAENFALWRSSLVKALETFGEMRPWMRASDRTPDIISALFESLTSDSYEPFRTPSATDGSLDLFGWSDEQLLELDWSTFLGDENLNRGIFPVLY